MLQKFVLKIFLIDKINYNHFAFKGLHIHTDCKSSNDLNPFTELLSYRSTLY